MTDPFNYKEYWPLYEGHNPHESVGRQSYQRNGPIRSLTSSQYNMVLQSRLSPRTYRCAGQRQGSICVGRSMENAHG